MLLSIGMIVKNEEKYLERCLTALKPILDNVDSELIIADTGSTDGTVEIAKKFTDNVFHFEWINDFAAARNSTLDKAKGEWYMFIDADEFLVDCTEIIDFFNSGEYKNYGSGTYIIKNYNDLSNMELFNTCSLHRLTALKDGVRFEKPVHENFSKFLPPVKNFNVIADHYGYVFKDNGKTLDVAEQKTSRNLELLFQELEEGKKTGNVKDTVYGQISDCYIILNKFEEALEYIDQGLENCRPDSLVMINYYLKKVKTLNSMGRHREIEETCQKYFSKENKARTGRLVSDSTMYFYWASANFVYKNYDEVINKAAFGFEIYRNYHSGKLYTEELNYCVMETTIPMLKQICNMFLIACTAQERYNDALRLLPSIPLEDFMPDTEFMKSHLNLRNLFMDKTNYNKLPDLFYSLDKPNREIYIDILLLHIFRAEKKEQLLKKLSAISGENERLADIIKIFESYFIHHNLYPTQTSDFIEKYGAKNNEAVWILMMKNHFDITPFICAEDFEPTESVEGVYIGVRQADMAMDLFDSSIYTLSREGVEKAVEPFGRAVLSATEKRFNTTKVIRTFGNLGKRWRDLNPYEEIPEKVAFALTLDEISTLHRKKHYDESLERIKELIGEDPDKPNEDAAVQSSEETAELSEEISAPTPDGTFEPIPEKNSEQPRESTPEQEPKNAFEEEKSKILRHYFLVISLDKKNNTEMLEKHSENPAMVELAERIKQEIRMMIENWDLNGAEAALNQMAAMAPFDADIENIRDEITDRKINYMKYM